MLAGSCRMRRLNKSIGSPRKSSSAQSPLPNVFEGAQVSDDAKVSGDALVFGNCRIYGNARVYGDA